MTFNIAKGMGNHHEDYRWRVDCSIGLVSADRTNGNSTEPHFCRLANDTGRYLSSFVLEDVNPFGKETKRTSLLRKKKEWM